jgi:hypothetical protein
VRVVAVALLAYLSGTTLRAMLLIEGVWGS